MKKITKIEKRLSFPEPVKLLRVAAYARVSTDEEKQQNSLAAQTDYYRTLINSNKEWVFAGIYADNGISGLSYHKREAFKRMIADCDAGCIDRFAHKKDGFCSTLTFVCVFYFGLCLDGTCNRSI